MNVLDAAFTLAEAYPGGAEMLAQRINHPNLSDELNPNRKTAKLGLHTAVQMEIMADDYRILRAHALACCFFPPVQMPEATEGAAKPCIQTLARVAQEFGDLMAEVSKDLADNEISDNELKRIERTWLQLMQTGQGLLEDLGALNVATKARRGGA